MSKTVDYIEKESRKAGSFLKKEGKNLFSFIKKEGNKLRKFIKRKRRKYEKKDGQIVKTMPDGTQIPVTDKDELFKANQDINTPEDRLPDSSFVTTTEEVTQEEQPEQTETSKKSPIMYILAVLILAGAVYFIYRYTKKKS